MLAGSYQKPRCEMLKLRGTTNAWKYSLSNKKPQAFDLYLCGYNYSLL